MHDLYAVLGVPSDAEIAQIRERYRFLAQAYHPDKFSSDAHKRQAEDAFKGINEAFQTLSNPSLRDAYDRQRASGPASQPKSTPSPPPAPEPPQPPKQDEATRSRGVAPLTPRAIA
jgi:curved DNA-binding protein CbpA